jgi:hypothetical protein
MIVPDPEMTPYELDTLRILNGEVVRGYVAGAAANVCAAWLKGRGYAEGHYAISHKGREYLAAMDTGQAAPEPQEAVVLVGRSLSDINDSNIA